MACAEGAAYFAGLDAHMFFARFFSADTDYRDDHGRECADEKEEAEKFKQARAPDLIGAHRRRGGAGGIDGPQVATFAVRFNRMRGLDEQVAAFKFELIGKVIGAASDGPLCVIIGLLGRADHADHVARQFWPIRHIGGHALDLRPQVRIIAVLGKGVIDKLCVARDKLVDLRIDCGAHIGGHTFFAHRLHRAGGKERGEGEEECAGHETCHSGPGAIAKGGKRKARRCAFAIFGRALAFERLFDGADLRIKRGVIAAQLRNALDGVHDGGVVAATETAPNIG